MPVCKSPAPPALPCPPEAEDGCVAAPPRLEYAVPGEYPEPPPDPPGRPGTLVPSPLFPLPPPYATKLPKEEFEPSAAKPPPAPITTFT